MSTSEYYLPIRRGHALSFNGIAHPSVLPWLDRLQQTQYDNISAIRIFARLDDAMSLLAKELGLDAVPVGPYTPNVPEKMLQSLVFETRYNAKGEVSSPAFLRWNSMDMARLPYAPGCVTPWH